MYLIIFRLSFRVMALHRLSDAKKRKAMKVKKTSRAENDPALSEHIVSLFLQMRDDPGLVGGREIALRVH
jgi:hypothetical protein